MEQSGKGYPRVHPTVLVRNPIGRRAYGIGSATGIIGATGLGVGLHNLTRRETKSARADPIDFTRAGIIGTVQANQDKAHAPSRGVSPGARVGAIGASAAAGAVGSRVVSSALRGRRFGRVATPAASAIGGVTLGAASLPLTNRVARRHGYEVTPTGVKRRKTAAVRPTRSAKVIETRAGRSQTFDARSQIVPSDRRGSVTKLESNYPGRDLTPGQKRAHVYAAGAVPGPGVGALAAATEAGRLAPPEQRKSAFASQLGGWGAGAATGIAVGSQAAAHSKKAADFSARVNAKRADIARGHTGFLARRVAPHEPGRVGRSISRMAAKPGAVGRFAKPLAEHPGAAALGGYAGKTVGAAVGGFAGYSLALRREKERNAKLNSVDKAIANGVELTHRQRTEQLRRKRRSLGVSVVATGVGSAGLGVLAARELGPHLPMVGAKLASHKAGLERAGLSTALGGGGVGAYQGVNSIHNQRADIKHSERELKSARAAGVLVPRQVGLRASFVRRSAKGTLSRVANTVAKLSTTLSSQDAQHQVKQYGLRGPLPKTLDRPSRMRAYEGRYIAAGGPKGERWQHRSDDLDHITGATIGTAAGAIGAKLAVESKPGKRLIKAPPHFAPRAGKVAEVAGAIGASSELLHRHAQHKASSYKSSPGGVAASALTRLRAYSPDSDQEG